MLLVFLCLLAAACGTDGILVRVNRTRHAEPGRFGCFFGDLSTQSAFTAAAQTRAQDGDLLLFNVNGDYVSLALRLVGNLARLGVRNYVAVGFDEDVCRRLHQHGVCCGYSSLLRGHAGVDAWQLGQDGAFADRREKTILFTLKLQTMAWALEAVKRVVHIDLDVVVLQPPFLLFREHRFGPAAFACAVDMPTLPEALAHKCASAGALPLHTTVPRQRLNTGLIFADGRFGGALRLINQTLSLILKRFDDAILQPPPPCGTCPFPLLPDWDSIWEQARFVLNKLVEKHTPPIWNVSCANVSAVTPGRVPYPWCEVVWPAGDHAQLTSAEPMRLVALPETATGRLCAVNASLSAAAPAQLAALPLLDAWPRPLAAGHLVFTPNRVRLMAMRALGAWYHANGTSTAGGRDGVACFQRSGESVVLLSQSGQSVLVICTAEPREDGRPCCAELETAQPWPIAELPAAYVPLETLRSTLPGCMAWEWETL